MNSIKLIKYMNCLKIQEELSEFKWTQGKICFGKLHLKIALE